MIVPRVAVGEGSERAVGVYRVPALRVLVASQVQESLTGQASTLLPGRVGPDSCGRSGLGTRAATGVRPTDSSVHWSYCEALRIANVCDFGLKKRTPARKLQSRDVGLRPSLHRPARTAAMTPARPVASRARASRRASSSRACLPSWGVGCLSSKCDRSARGMPVDCFGHSAGRGSHAESRSARWSARSPCEGLSLGCRTVELGPRLARARHPPGLASGALCEAIAQPPHLCWHQPSGLDAGVRSWGRSGRSGRPARPAAPLDPLTDQAEGAGSMSLSS